jgi:hypothetical protein
MKFTILINKELEQIYMWLKNIENDIYWKIYPYYILNFDIHLLLE